MNPYIAPNDETSSDVTPRLPQFPRGLIGFVCGALPALMFGLFRLWQHGSYVASLPPGSAACGTGALGSIVLIVFVAPLCGFVGTGVEWLSHILSTAYSRSQ